MTCPCVDTINEKLAPEHTLNVTLTFDGSPSRALIGLIRCDTWSLEGRRSKRRTILANYCPWCGVRYFPEDAAEDGQDVARASGVQP